MTNLASGLALLPLNIDDLLELEVGGVGREQTSSLGVGRGQADLRVDVQHVALAAAGRHDGGRAVGFVVLEVVASDWAVEGVLSGGL